MSRLVALAIAALAGCTPDAIIARRDLDGSDVTAHSCRDAALCPDDAGDIFVPGDVFDDALGIDVPDVLSDAPGCPTIAPTDGTACGSHDGASCRYPVADHCASLVCGCVGHWSCTTVSNGTCDAAHAE